MDIREKAIETLKNNSGRKPVNSLLQKAKVFFWESGLSPVMNALPSMFGEQAVIYFPGRSGKYSFPCCEHNGSILLALGPDEFESLKDLILQNPAVELWLKNGWFTGTVRLLTGEEAAAAAEIPETRFFGNAGENISKRSLKNCKILEATRSAPCTGTGGPGSKAWIWAVAAGLILFTKKKK